MRLIPKRSGYHYVTSYLMSLGSAEAKKLGFVTEGGTRLDLTKELDYEHGVVTIRITDPQPEPKP